MALLIFPNTPDHSGFSNLIQLLLDEMRENASGPNCPLSSNFRLRGDLRLVFIFAVLLLSTVTEAQRFFYELSPWISR
jgi:hypothetical protein